MSFDLAHPALRRALEERGYAEPTPVQAAVLKEGLETRDLLVSAQTGSGKTVGFGLTLAPTLLGDADRLPHAPSPLAIVIAPTRELAMQVERELSWLYRPAGGRVCVCVGGTDMRRQLRALSDGQHIVVGTPGRLVDLLERGALDLKSLRAIVLDEADEMLDMGFREELEKLLTAAPAERRTLLFSATLPEGILGLTKRYQKNAERLAVSSGQAHADIQYRAVLVSPAERERAVVNVLRLVDAPGALVFVSTREAVHHLHARLMERGFSATALSGDFTQAERSRSLQALRDGRARVLVATDVAARGLDLPDLALVIHADLPLDAEALLHRSGRTGRAGRKGLAVLIVPQPRKRVALRLLHEAKLKATWSPPPMPEEILANDPVRIAAAMVPEGESTEEDLAVARALLAAHDPERLVAAWVREHRDRLPAPEELPGTRYVNEREAAAPNERPAAPGPRDERGPPRGSPSQRGPEGIWFRVNVGRRHNADPRWMVPLICRRGQVQKAAIGQIRIFNKDSHFEIHPSFAADFEAAAAMPDRKEPGVLIERV